ncbi:hypothetical protein D3C85_1592720 [compost metagenome]
MESGLGCWIKTWATPKILLDWKNNTWLLKASFSPSKCISSVLNRASTSMMETVEPIISRAKAHSNDIIKSGVCKCCFFLNGNHISMAAKAHPSIA